MNAFFQNIMDSVLGGIKLKMIRQLWRILNGLRRFCVLIVMFVFSLMMMTLGLFGSIAYSLFQWSNRSEIQFDALLNFMLGDFIFFLLMLLILLSKSTWLKASGLAKHFETL